MQTSHLTEMQTTLYHPMDPSGGTAENTGYTICTIKQEYKFSAPNAEVGKLWKEEIAINIV